METISVNIALLKSLLSLATVIEAKDPYTGGHTWRVSRYARMLADHVGLSRDESFVVYFGSLVHDIGKVSVPEPILSKPGKLSAVEYEIVKKHPGIGRSLVSDHPLGWLTQDIVASHHERYDGQGYPNGQAREQISIMARIVAIADAFDAMTSTRPYRPGMPLETALTLMEKESGGQFDPALLAYFLELGRAGQFDHVLGHSAEERLLETCTTCGPIVALPLATRDGDHIVCPVCRGIYDVHADGGGFHIEWNGTEDLSWVPQPDVDTVSEVITFAPRELRLPSTMDVSAFHPV